MAWIRQLIVVSLIVTAAAPVAQAQERPARLRIDVPPALLVPPPRPVSAALHPAAKGAMIGAAIGAGSFGALGLWYCTIGPNGVGECGIEQWVPGLLVWGAVGAGIGALVGAVTR